jgi:hypothetical protein
MIYFLRVQFPPAGVTHGFPAALFLAKVAGVQVAQNDWAGTLTPYHERLAIAAAWLRPNPAITAGSSERAMAHQKTASELSEQSQNVIASKRLNEPRHHGATDRALAGQRKMEEATSLARRADRGPATLMFCFRCCCK